MTGQYISKLGQLPVHRFFSILKALTIKGAIY